MYVSSITLEKEKTANRMHASSGYALFIAVESVATTCNYHNRLYSRAPPGDRDRRVCAHARDNYYQITPQSIETDKCLRGCL